MGCSASLTALESIAANIELMKQRSLASQAAKDQAMALLIEPASPYEEELAVLKAMETAIKIIAEEQTKADNVDLPGNTLNKIPDGWTEGFTRFVTGDGAASVANTDFTKQITEMKDAAYYIIKEVRHYASGTVAADASHSIKDTETGTSFAEGYYNEGSFSIITGNKNGCIGRPLTQKPTVTLNSGTGMAAQKWYSSVKYYYR